MSFIIETKINIPQLPGQTIYRNRLTQKLDEGLKRKLTIVSAPAGFGKSTLLCQWLENININTAWFSLDEGDNNLNRFIVYIINSIQKQNPEIGKISLKIVQSEQKQLSIENILGHLINDIAKQRNKIILVLDDYHLIKLNDIHSALMFLLDHMPNNFHLFLLTRTDPPMLLSRLRGQNHFMDIRAKDLSFNLTESIDFFKSRFSLNLSEEQIELLNKRTEGWIAGLQMAAISLEGKSDITEFLHDFLQSNRYVLDYLIEEVFYNQSEEVQDFLMKTSILSRLNNSLCNAVTYHEYEHVTLEQLIKCNLFIIPLDDTGNWYRYHHLFADLLYKLLLKHIPDHIKDLNMRACQWYREQKFITDAMSHAIKAEEFSMAEDLISQIAERLWRQGEQGIILEWLKMFPADYEISNPPLCALLALMVFLDGRYNKAEDYILQAEKNLSHSNDEQLKGVIAAIRSHLANYRGRIEESFKFGNIALSTLTDKYSIWRSLACMALGDVYVQKGQLIPATESYREALRCGRIAGSNYCNTLVQHRFVVMHHRRGQLKKAIKLVEEYLSDDNQIANPSGALYLVQCELLYEFNRLEDAECSIRKALQLCEDQHHTAAFPYCHLQLARIFLALGDQEKAGNEIRESIKSLKKYNVPHWVESFVIAWQVNYFLKNGDLYQADTLLIQRNLPVPCKFSYPNEMEYLVYARRLAIQDKADQAIQILEQLDEWLISIEWNALSVEVKLVCAVLLFSQGNKKEALNKLKPALKLGNEEGYCRVFLDEHKSVQTLLEEAKSEKIYPEYCSFLLSDYREKDETIVYDDSVDPLSKRELQVLRLLNTRLTMREIAREFFVSDNTIKTHLKNIYSKLNVHSREAAIKKAEEMHII